MGLITGNVIGARYEYNIVAHNATATAPNPWVLNFDNGHGNPQGMQNCTFDHNIVYDWGSVGRGAQTASYQSNTLLTSCSATTTSRTPSTRPIWRR